MDRSWRNKLSNALSSLYGVLYWVFWAMVLSYLVLLGFYSLTRSHRFSPDSMNYVDVARNIATGRGIVQSTLGFNQPHFDMQRTFPTPITSQPPLYPILIALLAKLGIAFDHAALLIPVLCYGAILGLSYLIARETYDEHVALAAVACLLLFYPLQFVSTFAWSENVAIALAFLAFWLLARTRRTRRERITLPLLAGLATGLAFATRYAFLPLFFLGILLLIEPKDMRWTIRNLLLYAGAFAPLAVWIIARNMAYSDTWLGPSRNASLRGLGQNGRDAMIALFNHYLDQVDPTIQDIAFKSSLILFAIGLAARRTFKKTLEAVFLQGNRYLFTFWSFGYLFMLIYQRTESHFDRIGPRLVVPAGVTLVILWTALLIYTTQLKAKHLIYPALILAFLAIQGITRDIAETEPYNREHEINRSERLSWIASHTDENDLIVGDDVMDVPFYFGQRDALSFSPYPYTDYPEYEQIMAFVQQHCHEYEGIYLVLRNRFRQQESAARWMYGPFIADLISHRTAPYPGVIYRRRLSDGYVFEIQCAP